jgi:hypothetical protein
MDTLGYFLACHCEVFALSGRPKQSQEDPEMALQSQENEIATPFGLAMTKKKIVH